MSDLNKYLVIILAILVLVLISLPNSYAADSRIDEDTIDLVLELQDTFSQKMWGRPFNDNLYYEQRQTVQNAVIEYIILYKWF